MRTAIAEVSPTKVRSISLLVAILLVVALTNSAQITAPTSSTFLDPLPQDTGTLGLKQELRRLQTTGRLMMIVAHPDDEDGGLLTRESRGKGVTTLLQTLTRGEGGQNKTGNTFSDELGILRTLELLASGRYYGVEQRFTRVADFGYSKTPDETFQKWGGHDVPLQDIVWVIREFRPDVIIARFSGTDADGHGHHQASSILAREAFRAAADPNRFPEQIKAGLQPWQPKKLYVGNVCGFGASTCPDENWTVKINTGEEDPLLGMSYVQFAVQGLRHQQSQGLADIRVPSGPRYAFYKLVDSVAPNKKDTNGHETDPFDGIDTSVAGLSSNVRDTRSTQNIKEAADRIADAARSSDPDSTALVEPLLAALNSLSTASQLEVKSPDQATALVKFCTKQEQIRRAINLALGVELRASMVSPGSAGDREPLTGISPGQDVTIKVNFHNGSKLPLKLGSVSLAGAVAERGKNRNDVSPSSIPPGGAYEHTLHFRVPDDAPFTKPGFRRNDPQRDSVYTVDQPKLITLPFASMPAAMVHVGYELAVTNHSPEHAPSDLPEISAPVTVSIDDAAGNTRSAEVAVVPAFSVGIQPGDRVVPLSSHDPLEVNVRVLSNLDDPETGTLRLQAPLNSRISPPQQEVSFSRRGAEKAVQFKVTLPPQTQGHPQLRAVLSNGGKFYSESYTLVIREDLGSFYYFQPAVQHISAVDVRVPRDLKLGYIMGAGDDIPTVLQQIGMNIALVPADRIATENLSQFDTIVLGVRAYDTQDALVKNNKKLLDFVSRGGTLIVQNNNSVGDFNSGRFTPYPAELSRARVSVEDAPVQILAPDSPIFHSPNEITQKDFDGWVQERGLYFMSSWDEHFKPLLSTHDPGEPEQKGGLLVAKYGKGTYIYTGYAFFRQLPAGVPGAIRLFVNLVSAGKQAASN